MVQYRYMDQTINVPEVYLDLLGIDPVPVEGEGALLPTRQSR